MINMQLAKFQAIKYMCASHSEVYNIERFRWLRKRSSFGTTPYFIKQNKKRGRSLFNKLLTSIDFLLHFYKGL